jgi:hypothetical protein
MVTGEGMEGCMEAACLVSASALLLLGMAVYLGTQWTMMVELVLFRSIAISWKSQAVSYQGPRVRCIVWVITAWLLVNMWIWW